MVTAKPLLILCLGNELRADDAFGPSVAKELAKDGPFSETVEIVFVPQSGFGLLEYLQNRSSVLIVDAIRTGAEPPGTLHLLTADRLSYAGRPVNDHRMSLSVALETGRGMGLVMPLKVDVLAAEISDVESVSDDMSSEITRAVAPAVEYVRKWIHEHLSP